MAPSDLTGSAAYKKKDGILAMSKDRQSVSWTPVAPPDSAPQVVLHVPIITNLQQTPSTNPKVMLKIYVQRPGTTETEDYVFNFTSGPNARAEADAIKDVLSTSIQNARAETTALPTAPAGVGGASAALAIASAVSSGAASKSWENDAQLKGDISLQQSLMDEKPELKRMFTESLRTKPESMSIKQFTEQFWSTRVNLLRAHALEKSQSRGSYNVLATMEKAKKESGSADGNKLKLTREQVQLIFQQYPLVKKAYDEKVPKPLNENDFWSRFFQSRLLKRLRGEKITENDPIDKELDRYLGDAEDLLYRTEETVSLHIPHTIDLEGNEVNHSQKKGNQPDFTMRPSARVPIIRTLNALSEKIMAQVAPSDVDPSQPIGMDEETFNELQLRDLRGDVEGHHIALNIRDQNRFFTGQRDDEESIDAAIFRRNPKKALRKIQADLTSLNIDAGGIDLAEKIGWEDTQMDSDDEDERPENVGSKGSLAQASAQVIEAIRQRRSQTQDMGSLDTSHVETDTAGLAATLFDRLSLTHATTTEFLHQFWLAFLSGDPDRVSEIASLVESLNRSMDRIKAVADEAEAELKKEREAKRTSALEQFHRTQRKPREGQIQAMLNSIQGGEKVVNQMMAPTTRAVAIALSEYKKALAKDTTAAMQIDGQ